MTTSRARRPGRPGCVLIAIADHVFDEPARSRVALPAIADLQLEVAAAGAHRGRRLAARVRGYVAFWKLVVAAPLIMPAAPISGPLTTVLFGRSGGRALGILVVTLCAAIWPMFGWFVAAAMVGGGALAMVLHWWHDRHPSVVATASPLASLHNPEINMSSIPVAGDIGGLFFVVGSLMIVLLGLPELRWFALGTAVAGGLLSRALFRWRSSHRDTPSSILR